MIHSMNLDVSSENHEWLQSILVKILCTGPMGRFEKYDLKQEIELHFVIICTPVSGQNKQEEDFTSTRMS